jgi:hypothetical protein
VLGFLAGYCAVLPSQDNEREPGTWIWSKLFSSLVRARLALASSSEPNRLARAGKLLVPSSGEASSPENKHIPSHL